MVRGLAKGRGNHSGLGAQGGNRCNQPAKLFSSPDSGNYTMSRPFGDAKDVGVRGAREPAH